MSQMRKRSSNEKPVERDAQRLRRSCAPARPGAEHAVNGARTVRPARSVDLVAPPQVDQRLRGDALVEDLLGARLRDVHERRERRAPGVGERVREQLAVAVERARGRPRDALRGDLLARADRGPDVEHVALLADRLGADEVARGAACRARPTAPPSGRAAAPSSARPARRRRRARARAASSSCLELRPRPPGPARPSRSRGRSMPDSSSHSRETSNGRQCSKIGQRPYCSCRAAWQASNASLSVPPRALHGADLADHDVEEVRGSARSPRRRPSRAAAHGAAPADQRLGADRGDRRPSVAAPTRGGRRRRCRARPAASTRSPAKRTFCRGSQADDVALGVAAAAVLQHQVAAVAAEVDGEPVGERERGPGEAGHRVGLLGQARHAAELRRPVLLAALGDQLAGLLVRDDHVGVERAGAQHPHGVVVRQHQVAHRLVGVLAQQGEPVAARRPGWPSPRSRRGSPRPRSAPTLGSPSAVSA